jgi:cysteinyl-tRNA synthetase
MTLKLYNSLTRSTEEFVPIDPAHVRMYVCGPTVYDRAHIGNARPVVVFDVLFRLLQRHYGEDKVTYARNITDVDDKIIDAAIANGEEIDALTQRTTAFFHADMAALNALPPTVEPRATAHIHDMIEMIADLIDSGNAYEAEGHVLFAVSTSADYGKLSGRSLDEQIAGARVEVAPYKKDPADFVLWKPSPEDYLGWESPWGRGRPGWHIECSAMALRHLGETFDIHAGGIDLIFPHHENEIAQSTCANDAPMAKVWMHNGHVVVGGQKMSKSLGNFITVEQLLKRFPGEVMRLALLSAHYRQPLDITDDLLTQAKARLDYLYGVLRRNPPNGSPATNTSVAEALDDDLNTPQALSALQELGRQVEAGTVGGDALLDQGALLGLLQADPVDWFRWEPADATGLTAQQIDLLIEQRRTARDRRDFAEADRLRNELLAAGVVLEDSAQGTIWRREL